MGILSGPCYPAVTQSVAVWIPKQEASTAVSVVWSGGWVGALVSMVEQPFVSYSTD